MEEREKKNKLQETILRYWVTWVLEFNVYKYIMCNKILIHIKVLENLLYPKVKKGMIVSKKTFETFGQQNRFMR